MARRSRGRHKHRIENKPQKRDVGSRQHIKHIAEVFHRGVVGDQLRRENQQLVVRLEGVGYDQHHRQRHNRRTRKQKKQQKQGTRPGAVDFLPSDKRFDMQAAAPLPGLFR